MHSIWKILKKNLIFSFCRIFSLHLPWKSHPHFHNWIPTALLYFCSPSFSHLLMTPYPTLQRIGVGCGGGSTLLPPWTHTPDFYKTKKGSHLIPGLTQGNFFCIFVFFYVKHFIGKTQIKKVFFQWSEFVCGHFYWLENNICKKIRLFKLEKK